MRTHGFRSIEQDLSLAFSFSLHHPILEMRIRTIAYPPSINLSWFLLILGWRVGVHWGYELKFLLDCLCPLMAWQRVVFLCLLAVRQPSWWSKKEPHWYSHRSFIFNDLEVFCVPMVVHDSMRHSWQTTDACHDVVASHHLGPYCRHVSWSFRGWWERYILAISRWIASCFSSAT